MSARAQSASEPTTHFFDLGSRVHRPLFMHAPRDAHSSELFAG